MKELPLSAESEVFNEVLPSGGSGELELLSSEVSGSVLESVLTSVLPNAFRMLTLGFTQNALKNN